MPNSTRYLMVGRSINIADTKRMIWQRTLKVLTCIPVLSTLNAKLPLPTWRGVVMLLTIFERITLYRETVRCLQSVSLALKTYNVSITYRSIFPRDATGSASNAWNTLIKVMTRSLTLKLSLEKFALQFDVIHHHHAAFTSLIRTPGEELFPGQR